MIAKDVTKPDCRLTRIYISHHVARVCQHQLSFLFLFVYTHAKWVL